MADSLQNSLCFGRDAVSRYQFMRLAKHVIPFHLQQDPVQALYLTLQQIVV